MQDQERSAVEKIIKLGVSDKIAQQILKPLAPDYKDSDVDDLYKVLENKRCEIDSTIANVTQLSFDEAKTMVLESILNVNEETLDKILQHFDVDESGDIDTHEFKGIMLFLSSRILTLGARFESMDADESGCLEYSEIDAINEEYGESADYVVLDWLTDHLFEEENKMSKAEFIDKWKQLLHKREDTI